MIAMDTNLFKLIRVDRVSRFDLVPIIIVDEKSVESIDAELRLTRVL